MTSRGFLLLFAAAAMAAPARAAEWLSPVTDTVFFSALENVRQMAGQPRSNEKIIATAVSQTPDELRRRVALLLKSSNIPKDRVEKYVDDAFADPSVRIEPEVVELMSPQSKEEAKKKKKSYEEYREQFITPERIQHGVEFMHWYRPLLQDVEHRFGVDSYVLAGILGVETDFGRNKGKYRVFNAFYTIALQIPSHSRWAEKELAEWLKLCYGNRPDLHSALGSYAGAFGYAQFLPSSFNAYAVDFDGDGVRRHDDWPDVLGSVSNFLIQPEHGYDPASRDFSMCGMSKPSDIVLCSKNWRSIFAYNHDPNYVNVVLELRSEIMAAERSGKSISAE